MLISDMLEPKLTEWLNNNLSSVVEKIVQEEINKLFTNKNN
jgi:cell pole-organizing protein PopZ